MAKSKASKTKPFIASLLETKMLSALVFSLLIGVVGTLALHSSSAVAYTTGLYPDSTSVPPAEVIPGTGNVTAFRLGNAFAFHDFYKHSVKAPTGVVTCWYMKNAPAGWPNNWDYAAVGAALQTSPIFSKTIAPLPVPDQQFQIQTTGTGPAVCESQVYDGTNLLSTITFGTL